jgi:hypothetical protein
MVQLTAADVARLVAVQRALVRAQKDAEIAILEARVAVMKASRDQACCLDALAETYGIDARAGWTLDEATGTLQLASPRQPA